MASPVLRPLPGAQRQSTWPLEGLPSWWIDDLYIAQGNSTDEYGRRWTVSQQPNGEQGWSGSPAPRAIRPDRPNSHGTYRGVEWRGGRVITLAGSVLCPDAATREYTEHQLSALCSDPARLYEYRRRTEAYDQTADVALSDAPLVQTITLYRTDWSFQFTAPDPRKHDHAWQEPVVYPPTGGSSGLDYSAPGLDHSEPGLDYGPSRELTEAKVANYGTAPAYPIFTIRGPLDDAEVQHAESGRSIRYHGSVLAGETVTINCDDHPQRGWLGHARISSQRGNVAALCTVAWDWPVVDPQTVGTFRLLVGAAPPASLTVSLRSAWW